MSRLVDLHMHSIYSDGDKSPEELMQLAKQNNIGIMAITDHDNIMGSKELMKMPSRGMVRYSGVELTALVNKGRMHILGYNIDLDNAQLNAELDELQRCAIYNLLMYVDLLKRDFNIEIPKEEIDRLVNSKKNVGRPELALILIKMQKCATIDQAFDIYLNPVMERVRKVKKGLSPEECIELINNAGGVASLAHPCSLKLDDAELEERIQTLKAVGLRGIEIQHIHTTAKERAFYAHLATKYDLLETGGTDYHGPAVKPNVMIGSGINHNVHIEEDTLSLVLKIKSRYQ